MNAIMEGLGALGGKWYDLDLHMVKSRERGRSHLPILWENFEESFLEE